MSETVLQVKEGGKLVTAEYILSKIIKASDDQTWYKIGNRKILMSCEAHLKAGVDLEQISENNFDLSDSILTVTVPPAQLFSLSLPPEKIQVRYQEIDLLRDPFSANEREQLLAQAERQIRQLADSLGILETAQNNAALFLQKLLQQAGYEKVRIHFEKRR
ncbi:MAG: DUF4230 domain-containing protein [Flavisolibacter sp.]|nr:DUF4230 domain-containing protein [Flavisolibacter sp.]